ncbi:MAG: hypothetical protein IPM24_07685 [Bryobacterales bacterium]|nr:hypothetical protein [Bryobacterales bacterium]
MRNGHWNQDELIAWLYGVGPEDGHLDSCGECRAKAERLQSRMTEARMAEPDVHPAFLARQRRSVLDRIAGGAPSPARWLATAAVAAMLLMAVALQSPSPQPEALTASSADTELFEDVFNTVAWAEPEAVAPLYGLFERSGEVSR